MPISFTIHNVSKYIHEKNVEYRILCSEFNIIEPNRTLSNPSLDGCDIHKKAREILHYNMPYFQEYVLVTSRISSYSKPIEVNIMISVWGEFSPVVISNYKLEIYGDRNTNTIYTMKEKNENFYLYEKSDELKNEERLENNNVLLLQSFEKRLNTFPLFKQLY